MVGVESNTRNPRQHLRRGPFHGCSVLVHIRPETGIGKTACGSCVARGRCSWRLRSSFVRFASIVLLTLVTINNAHGQTVTPLPAAPAPASAPAPAAPGPLKLGDVTVTGTLRSRAYAWNWFE